MLGHSSSIISSLSSVAQISSRNWLQKFTKSAGDYQKFVPPSLPVQALAQFKPDTARLTANITNVLDRLERTASSIVHPQATFNNPDDSLRSAFFTVNLPASSTSADDNTFAPKLHTSTVSGQHLDDSCIGKTGGEYHLMVYPSSESHSFKSRPHVHAIFFKTQ